MEEGEPPPKSAFYLFDRPLPESGQPQTAENVPNALGQLLLWGKQTDREARVVALSLPTSALDAVQSYLERGRRFAPGRPFADRGRSDLGHRRIAAPQLPLA